MTPHKIGDKIEDTEAFGTVTIQDIYISPTTKKIVYEVVSDEYMVCFAQDSDLVSMS